MISYGVNRDCDNNAETGKVYGKRGGVIDCALSHLKEGNQQSHNKKCIPSPPIKP